MGEGVESLLWDGVVLGSSICPYCNGFPFGQRHYDCKNFKYCGSLDSESFKIPKDKAKITLFLHDYQSGNDFFTIAKKVWGSDNTEKIKENAKKCQGNIGIVPDIGDLMMTRLADAKDPDEYMTEVVDRLRKML
jgi:hypothetical protein